MIESNPITKLSSIYNNKFLTKIKDTFTESQQQLFVSSFYCYLNYHPTNDFVIDLDDVWKWLGFNQKYNALRLLEKQFVLDKDYKSLLLRSDEQKKEGRGGHNKDTIMLNIKTFKLFCIKADTKKAQEIHEYFIKLEELMQTIVQEESDELKLQLDPNVDVRRTVALGSAPFVPYGRNLDRPTVGRRDDAVNVVEASENHIIQFETYKQNTNHEKELLLLEPTTFLPIGQKNPLKPPYVTRTSCAA